MVSRQVLPKVLSQPAQAPNSLSASETASSVTAVPRRNGMLQPGQMMGVSEVTTVPPPAVPPPAIATLRVSSATNVALTTVGSLVMVSVHEGPGAPEQARPQPVNSLPVPGVAVKVMVLPTGTVAAQLVGQAIPKREDVTEPVPL